MRSTKIWGGLLSIFLLLIVTHQNCAESTGTGFSNQKSMSGLQGPGDCIGVCPAAFEITLDPKALEVEQSGDLVLKVETDVDASQLDFSWYKDGKLVLSKSGGSTLSILDIKESDAGMYYVDISDEESTVRSGMAKVNVIMGVPTAPAIITQPAAAVVITNMDHTVSVEAKAFPRPTYQWYKDTIAITGATLPTLDIIKAAPSHSGKYHVVISNSLGSISSGQVDISVANLVNLRSITRAYGSEEVVSGNQGSSLGYIFDKQIPGTTALYRCSYSYSRGGTAILVSPTCAAEGLSPASNSLLGYAWSASKPNTMPLNRCVGVSNNGHLVTHGNCPTGFALESVLGHALLQQ